MTLDLSTLAFRRAGILSCPIQKERNRRAAVCVLGEAVRRVPVPVLGPPAPTGARPGFRPASMREKDNELVRSILAARSGDGEAFRHVFSRFAKPILSFIFSLTGDQARAEELTQETFIRSYRKLASLRNTDQLSTWLFGIARNVVREAVREKYRESRIVALEDAQAESLSDQRLTPQGEFEAGELNRRIREALAALPEHHRTVFVLKVLHDMRYDEIAAITGASVGKLKTDLHRARAEMRRRLGLYLGRRAGTTRGDEL